MPSGYEIEQAVHPGLKVRLAGLELPQLLAPRLDRLGGEIEPPREEIAQPLGNEEALLDRIKDDVRSEEHTSELQSLMRTSYAVFCLKKKKHELKAVHTNSNVLSVCTHTNAYHAKTHTTLALV